MYTVARLRFRTATRGYISFDVLYSSYYMFEADYNRNFLTARIRAIEADVLGPDEVIYGVNYEVFSQEVELVQ